MTGPSVKKMDGEQNHMQSKIDEAANNWNKTKDPKYKDLWYKLVRKYGTFIDHTTRRNVQSGSDNDHRRFIFLTIVTYGEMNLQLI